MKSGTENRANPPCKVVKANGSLENFVGLVGDPLGFNHFSESRSNKPTEIPD